MGINERVGGREEGKFMIMMIYVAVWRRRGEGGEGREGSQMTRQEKVFECLVSLSNVYVMCLAGERPQGIGTETNLGS